MPPYTVYTRDIRAFPDPVDAFSRLKGRRPAALLESARTHASTGRFSILAVRPFLAFEHADGRTRLTDFRSGIRRTAAGDPFKILSRLLKKHAAFAAEASVPFAGGAVGFFSYECKELLEKKARSHFPEMEGIPKMYFLFFDSSFVWNHEAGCIQACVLEASAGEKKQAAIRAAVRLDAMARALKKIRPAFKRKVFPRSRLDSIRFSMSEDAFKQAVRRIQDSIRAGEIFQANLAHSLQFPVKEPAEAIYARLRKLNPSPFFGLLDTGSFQILSGSPERLLCLRGRILETRPIAGTRARGRDLEADRAVSQELLLNEKERAEHVMLVDLERNDLGRVCEYGSVAADEFMVLEDYSHVKHIVSNVRGVLRKELDALEALKAVFPGGTITGAPKVRCMQIIDEVEKSARGPYTGSLGYFSATGEMDFNILIRSLVLRKGRAVLHVGAGIVADSDPTKEYHETLYKAQAVLEAAFGKRAVRAFYERRGIAGRVS